MRLLSWNINGVRTLPQYHPWNTFKSFEEILDSLGADIICFQEMKTSRIGLDQNLAMPGHYDGFFSFPVNKGGYSGVAVYTDSRTVVPLRAEEGLSGKLQPKPPLSADERVSQFYPYPHEMDLMPNEDGNTLADFTALDGEGRALVLDFGLFVFINVYCPNLTSEERLPFKTNFHYLLEERVRKLVQVEGREVIVAGDINICATPFDHCDGHLPSNVSTFYDSPPRVWFKKWLDPDDGMMVDIVRQFWPDRKGLYTCWNQKIFARETNYGTRIDYILVTRGLLKWIKHGDIQSSVKGSDHCPIYIDFHDEIVSESGETLTLKQVMRMEGDRSEAPRIAAKFWEEFSGKQTKLSTFFGKRGDVPPKTLSRTPSSSQDDAMSSKIPESSFSSAKSLKPSSVDKQPSSAQASSSDHIQVASASSTSNSGRKRKSAPDLPPSTSRRKVDKSLKKPGQVKLSAFFTKAVVCEKGESAAAAPLATEDSQNLAEDYIDVDADYELAMKLASSQDSRSSQPTSLSSPSTSQSKAAWSQLMAPIQPPRCTVHDEPAKEWTVNKSGPNKGKKFFLCSRPVGPGYDKGRAERLREEVDPTYRCNFFKWSSEVKRETRREVDSKGIQ